MRLATNPGGFDPRGDIRSASFIRELVKFGVEVARVNPTVTTRGETVISEFLNTLWSGGDERKGQAGLNQFFEGVKTSDERMKLLGFGDRLLDAAQLMQGQELQTQKKDAKFLSQLLNLGSAYAAINPTAAQDQTEFFLNSLWQSQSSQKGATELEDFLNRFDGDDQKLLNASRNRLQLLNSIPSPYIQEEIRDSSIINNWLNEAAFYGNLRLNLEDGKTIFDPGGFQEKIWQASTTQELRTVSHDFYNYVIPDNILVASNSTDKLIAQSEIWGGVGNGLGVLIGGTLTLAGGAFYFIVDKGGKIISTVFHSDEKDDRTVEEKVTDGAVGKLLEGAIPTDRAGNPLKPGQKKKEGDLENFVKPSNNPEQKQKQDIEQLAGEAGTPLKRIDTPRGKVQTTDLLDGGTAGAYPQATSTGERSTQINLRQKDSPTRKTIKIRYRDNRKATIVIPTV
ncbi:MAG: hypothetical protein HC780_13440 [Leptolyngbyaceae cyanobacterium CSU_1_3]|nr:hypothetical protein [Leptolyngbyaceae cyanobacterium CSU_1_3]